MSNYFNIKYVSEGPYFNVKGGTPPAPTLPTVTYLSTVYGLLSTASIASGGTTSPLKSRVGGVYDGDYFTKDNSKQYAFFRYNNGIGYKNAGGIFEVAWSRDNYLCAKNVTDGTEDLESVRIAECSSANAQVVTVYDIEYGYASYAFKFNLSGTYYYSILDSGLHPGEWTDDLTAAGYTEDSPEPPVALPTVILMAYNSNEWNYPGSFNTYPLTFVSGEQAQLYIASDTSFSYESDKVYSVGEYQNPSGTTTGRYGFSVVSVNSKIGCKNISGGSITVQRMSVYRCSDPTATVVTVYNSSNVAYNAFKFTASGTDYYYVLDGTQTDWTDDLASIGYHLSVVLPTVTLASAYVYNASDPSTMTIWAGNSFMAKDAAGNSINYDASLLYKAYASYADTSSPIWFNNGWTPVESSGLLAIMNNASSGNRTVHHVCYATCSDSSAIIITVYNASNNPYNAFKFIANGTDYYYVLDGTQTDWTDDLASIGYSLTPVVFRAWFNPDKSYRIAVTNGWSGMLYGNDGNYAPYDNTKTYVIHSVINSSGSPISVNVSQLALSQDGGAYMRFANNSGTTLYNVVYIEYTVS